MHPQFRPAFGTLVVVLALSRSAMAGPIVYEYLQTGASVPRLVIDASITIDGVFADLPSLDCALGCYDDLGFDFGHLLDLSVTVPAFVTISFPSGRPIFGVTYTLDDFVVPRPGPCPIPGGGCGPAGPTAWSIRPGGIFFASENGKDSFLMNFAAGTISYSTDSTSDPPDCHFSGVCVAQGTWVATPEPASLILLGTGTLALVARVRSRRKRTMRSAGE